MMQTDSDRAQEALAVIKKGAQDLVAKVSSDAEIIAAQAQVIAAQEAVIEKLIEEIDWHMDQGGHI